VLNIAHKTKEKKTFWHRKNLFSEAVSNFQKDRIKRSLQKYWLQEGCCSNFKLILLCA
jgi:hypothetical protein